MKKSLIIAGLACVALAACTKNEVVSVAPDQEITFQTVINPSTKALSATQKTFSTSNVFRTWAFHDQTNWSSSSSTAQLYLGGTDGVVISHDGTQWKNATQSYYWPKTGKLTFFSYSTNANTCALTGATVACSNADGITVTNFDITQNNDVDFMVADIAKDQTQNTNTYEHTGVPTLFRHKLSNVIFKIKTSQAYAGKTFKLNSIELINIAKTANYTQSAGTPASEGWNALTKENKEFVATAVEFSSSEVTPTATRSYYIPMTFAADQKVKVTFTISTDNGTGSPATETVEVEKALTELFPNSWEMGKRYTCTITVSLNEILWDPAIEDWVDGDSNPVSITD